MLTRYLITLGATTTAGGKVISASSFRSINDVDVAVEDDRVQCPKCNSIGVIKPDGPRLSETCNDKEVALHDDLCICKCNPPPRLIANQSFVYQSIDAQWQAAEAVSAAANATKHNAVMSSTNETDGVPRGRPTRVARRGRLPPQNAPPCSHGTSTT